jgi:hypothetical protein
MSFVAELPPPPAVHAEVPESFLGIGGINPAPGPGRTRTWSRNLDCEWLAGQAGPRAYPGVIEPPRPRGDYIEQHTMVCRERVIRPGLRAPIDDALLTGLQSTAADIAERAAHLDPSLADATWLVEVFVPNATVGAKISFAMKNTLVGRGLSVTDRTPLLGAEDIGALTSLAPEQAYPAACTRYTATGAVREGDALLAVMLLDPRETALHGGVCVQGGWTWLP